MIFMLLVSVYTYLLLMMGGLTSSLLALFSMELLSWVFIIILEKPLTFKYLIIQSGFLFMAITGLMWSASALFMAVLLKMGLPPFHLWMFNFVSTIKSNSFLFLNTLHKILPLFFLMKSLSITKMMAPLTSLLVFSGIMILSMKNLFFIMVASSMIHSSWIMISYLLSAALMLFYWSIYCIIFIMFIKSLSLSVMNFMDLTQTSVSSVMWLVLSGLPPFSLFWLKASIFNTLLGISTMMSMSIIIVAVLSLSAYYQGFHLTLSLNKEISSYPIMGVIVLGVGAM